ncbi:MAG: glycosyltransferase, partial [Xenococcus sp. (in: cyanobacteria)]
KRQLLALLYGSIFRKPVWIGSEVTIHTERGISIIKKIIRWLISRWSNNWVSYGKSATEYLVSLGIEPKNILEIQNTIDEQLYIHNSEPIVKLEPKPVLLYVGRLIMLKGIDKFFEAAAKLQSEGYEFSILLVGDGPEKESLKILAKKLNLSNVIFYGAQPAEAMPGIYRSADFLVFPTLDDVWGLVVNEALWSGLPVLSSIYAGCAKELLPKQNLFDPLNLDNFTNTLKNALEQKIIAANQSRLLSHSQVSKLIIDDINRVIEKNYSRFEGLTREKKAKLDF